MTGELSFVQHMTPTGRAAKRRLPDALHPGKNRETAREKIFFSFAVSLVFITPVGVKAC